MSALVPSRSILQITYVACRTKHTISLGSFEVVLLISFQTFWGNIFKVTSCCFFHSLPTYLHFRVQSCLLSTRELRNHKKFPFFPLLLSKIKWYSCFYTCMIHCTSYSLSPYFLWCVISHILFLTTLSVQHSLSHNRNTLSTGKTKPVTQYCSKSSSPWDISSWLYNNWRVTSKTSAFSWWHWFQLFIWM